VTTATIPNRAVFRAQEVCELAEVQPYVLRSWEAEFPDLGVVRSASGTRVYRRADVELVLRLKHLLFVDGLTLAGARKRLSDEGRTATEEAVSDADVAALMDDAARDQLRSVRRSLQWILGLLDGQGLTVADRVLHASPPAMRSKGSSKGGPLVAKVKGRSGKPAKRASRGRH
jgi:DNA-binding transcriptional MerR regulator